MTFTHEDIIEELSSEALGDRQTGWLSDMGQFELHDTPYDRAIEVMGAGNGSIDLSHLASIVEHFMGKAWQEGRESVAIDMASPLDDAGMRKVSKNPYGI